MFWILIDLRDYPGDLHLLPRTREVVELCGIERGGLPSQTLGLRCHRFSIIAPCYMPLQKLVELCGIEPQTYWIQALSQLSYSPGRFV